MCLVLYALQPEVFLTWRNVANVFKQTAVNSLLAIGMFLAILTAGIDLSVGSVLALGMMTLAVANAAGVPVADRACCSGPSSASPPASSTASASPSCACPIRSS